MARRLSEAYVIVTFLSGLHLFTPALGIESTPAPAKELLEIAEDYWQYPKEGYYFDPTTLEHFRPWYNGNSYFLVPRTPNSSVKSVVRSELVLSRQVVPVQKSVNFKDTIRVKEVVTTKKLIPVTSLIRKEVVTPYERSVFEFEQGPGPWRWNDQPREVFPSGKRAQNTFNIVTSVNSQTYVNSYAGGEAPSYWIQEGLPKNLSDLYSAYNYCLSQSGGNCAPLHIDGAGAGWAGSEISVVSGERVLALPDQMVNSTTSLRDRKVTFYYYSEKETKWRRAVVQVQDVNGNGRVDGQDIVVEGYIEQDRQKVARFGAKESGNRVVTVEEAMTELKEVEVQTEVERTEEVDRTEVVETEEERQKQEERSYEEKKRKDQWDVDISPLVFGNYMEDDILLSLDSHFSSPEIGTPENSNKLKLANPKAPYLRLKNRDWMIAGGALLELQNSAIPLFSAQAGGGLMIGRTKAFSRQYENLEEARLAEAPIYPTQVSDLEKWKVGDEMTFGANVGVMFLAGVNYYPFFFGISFSQIFSSLNMEASSGAAPIRATGAWETQIIKVSETRYYVRISGSRFSSLGPVFSAPALSLSLADLRGRELAFSVLFDTKDERAKQALSAFAFEYDARPAQQLAIADNSHVLPVLNEEKNVMGRSKSFSIGLIPAISSSWGHSELKVLQDTRYLPEGRRAQAYYGIQLLTQDDRFVVIGDSTKRGFIATFYDSFAKDGSFEFSNYFGQYVFSYRDNLTSKADFKEAISSLKRESGLGDVLSVELPEGLKSLESTTIDFQLTYNKIGLDTLLRLGESYKAKAIFRDLSQNLLAAYLSQNHLDKFRVSAGSVTEPKAHAYTSKDVRDPLGFCNSILSDESLSQSKGLKDKVYECVHQSPKTLNSLTEKFLESLARASQARDTLNKELFVAELARAGHTLARDPFLFQTALLMVAASTQGKGIEALYSVQGTNFKAYRIRPTWDQEIISKALANY